ncbi:MAG: hypothetical protein ACREP1_02130 [Rhodanobacteraceae bacterium]
MSSTPPVVTSWRDTPHPGSGAPRSRYNGIGWSYDANGIYVDGDSAPERTPGKPITCRAICALFAPILIERSVEWGIAPELIAMIIAAETAAFRASGYTGPSTFHWEPGVIVRDAPPPIRGDYSAGPMQILAGDARALIRDQGWDIDPITSFPAYRFRPAAPPEDIPGYRPDLDIPLGVQVMRNNRAKSGDDPILTAAAYNAGGIYDASKSRKFTNRWHLRSTGNYLDRAAKWYGDACAVIGALRHSA